MGFLKMDSPEGATGLNKKNKNKVGFLKMNSPEGATGLNQKFIVYNIIQYTILYDIIAYYCILYPGKNCRLAFSLFCHTS